MDDHLEQLLAGDVQREQVKHEFLLARERAVGPLLQAFDDPRFTPVRDQLVDILFSLWMRLDDPRISEALSRHLTSDLDPAVRTVIAERAELYNRTDMVPALLAALHDDVSTVRQHALAGLAAMHSRLDSTQRVALDVRVRQLLQDPHAGVRLEAQTRAAETISAWQAEANQLHLQALVGEAETVHQKAIDYAPGSKQAYFGLGWFYCESGQPERGYDILANHGLLLDVPHLDRPPVMDGRLDDDAWTRAAHGDTLYKFFWESSAWLVPKAIVSQFFVAYTDEKLFLGFRGHDAHIDSLVTKVTEPLDPVDDEQSNDGFWSDDLIELMLDTDLDRRSFIHVGVNSAGMRADSFDYIGPGSPYEHRAMYVADIEVKAHVGIDHWSLEIAFPFGQRHMPTPAPGQVWGFNFVRNFRGQEYLQWVRTYGSGLQPQYFGFLRFSP
jgi:hypothetical protein